MQIYGGSPDAPYSAPRPSRRELRRPVGAEPGRWLLSTWRSSLVLVEDKRCLENHSGTSSTISEHVAIVPLHFPTSFKLTSQTPTPNTIERPAACLLVVTARRSIAPGVRTDDLMVLEVTTDLLDEDATFARNGVSASLDQLQHIAVSDGPELPGVQAEFGTTGVFVFDQGLSGWRHH